MARLPGTLEGMTSPEICVVMAAASRSISAASMQLKPAHMAVEPVSAAIIGANTLALPASRSAALLRSARRAPGATSDQAGKAAAAASAARLASSTLAAAAREAGSPVSGLSRSKVAPPAALAPALLISRSTLNTDMDALPEALVLTAAVLADALDAGPAAPLAACTGRAEPAPTWPLRRGWAPTPLVVPRSPPR